MKKITSLLLIAVLAMSAFAMTGCFINNPTTAHKCESACETCGKCTDATCTDAACTTKCEGHKAPTVDINAKSEGVMTWAEYDAAELDTEVVVEAFVQGHQSWWDNKVTVYLQDGVGGYFAYEMVCSEEDAAKLVPGTKIRITGYKTEWAGEVEIDTGCTFEFVNDGITYIATPTDVTSLLTSADLVKYQNMLVSFKGMTFKELEYKDGQRGNDIYVTFTKDGVDYNFCVEKYLTGPSSDVYLAVEALQAGDVIDVEGFLYWYNGMNPHITKTLNIYKKSEGVMTWAEYDAAELDTEVVVEAFVQGHQSWWDNKVTVYLQDGVGGYFAYEMVCSEEDAAKLVPGTKIRITGYKTEWAGEVEIDTGCTFEFVNDGITYVASAIDVTSLLTSADLVKYQNMLVSFKDMTFKELEYKNGQRGNDIYVTFTKDGVDYNFCVESYLTGPSSDVYLAVEALEAGDVVDIEGFLYWYNGMNPHITSVK